jgi:YHS domain-containing protein
MERVATSNETILDPVCGMAVIPGKTRLVSVYKGSSYWFCAEGCRSAFESNPEKYFDTKTTKRKGIWGRYLERLNRATGGKPLKCH